MFMNKFTREMRGNLTYILTWKWEAKGKGGGEKDKEIHSFHISKTKLGIIKILGNSSSIASNCSILTRQHFSMLLCYSRIVIKMHRCPSLCTSPSFILLFIVPSFFFSHPLQVPGGSQPQQVCCHLVLSHMWYSYRLTQDFEQPQC